MKGVTFARIKELCAKHVPVWWFAAVLSAVNLALFHFPFFEFVVDKTNQGAGSKILFVASIAVIMFLLNFFVGYLVCFLLRKKVGQVLAAICFVLSCMCVYFVSTYNVIIDRSMLGNVFNTHFSEASGFISLKMMMCVVIFGIVPAYFIVKVKLRYGTWRRFAISSAVSLVAIVSIVGVNVNSFLWIGQYDTQLGALLMPWSYVVNTIRHVSLKFDERKPEIILPDAQIINNDKKVVVLVIGESARKANFSLYGYERNTNPRLSKLETLHVFDAQSCATYTTAGVKAILEYQESSKLYEILPNYMYRTGVDVQWRTANWGEPPLHIADVKIEDYLRSISAEADKPYDTILLTGLKQRIDSCKSDKLLIVLHTSTSHGPNYSKKYPKEFEIYKPVCDNVEQADKHLPELVNAYDNSIIFTDYLLNEIIEMLSEVKNATTAMIFVSDHGESLGENSLFMHGVPLNVAPREQYEIPFLIWTSSSEYEFKQPAKVIDQHYVFHTVMHMLDVESPVYNPNFDLIK